MIINLDNLNDCLNIIGTINGCFLEYKVSINRDCCFEPVKLRLKRLEVYNDVTKLWTTVSNWQQSIRDSNYNNLQPEGYKIKTSGIPEAPFTIVAGKKVYIQGVQEGTLYLFYDRENPLPMGKYRLVMESIACKDKKDFYIDVITAGFVCHLISPFTSFPGGFAPDPDGSGPGIGGFPVAPEPGEGTGSGPIDNVSIIIPPSLPPTNILSYPDETPPVCDGYEIVLYKVRPLDEPSVYDQIDDIAKMYGGQVNFWTQPNNISGSGQSLILCPFGPKLCQFTLLEVTVEEFTPDISFGGGYVVPYCNTEIICSGIVVNVTVENCLRYGVNNCGEPECLEFMQECNRIEQVEVEQYTEPDDTNYPISQVTVDEFPQDCNIIQSVEIQISVDNVEDCDRITVDSPSEFPQNCNSITVEIGNDGVIPIEQCSAITVSTPSQFPQQCNAINGVQTYGTATEENCPSIVVNVSKSPFPPPPGFPDFDCPEIVVSVNDNNIPCVIPDDCNTPDQPCIINRAKVVINFASNFNIPIHISKLHIGDITLDFTSLNIEADYFNDFAGDSTQTQQAFIAAIQELISQDNSFGLNVVGGSNSITITWLMEDMEFCTTLPEFESSNGYLDDWNAVWDSSSTLCCGKTECTEDKPYFSLYFDDSNDGLESQMYFLSIQCIEMPSLPQGYLAKGITGEELAQSFVDTWTALFPEVVGNGSLSIVGRVVVVRFLDNNFSCCNAFPQLELSDNANIRAGAIKCCKEEQCKNIIGVSVDGYPQNCNPILGVSIGGSSNPTNICNSITIQSLQINTISDYCNAIQVYVNGSDIGAVDECSDIYGIVAVNVNVTNQNCDPIIVTAEDSDDIPEGGNCPVVHVIAIQLLPENPPPYHFCNNLIVIIDEEQIQATCNNISVVLQPTTQSCSAIVVELIDTTISQLCNPIVVNTELSETGCDSISVELEISDDPQLLCDVIAVKVETYPQDCDPVTVVAYSPDENCLPIVVNVSEFPQQCNAVVVEVGAPDLICYSITVNVSTVPQLCNPVTVSVGNNINVCNPINVTAFPSEVSCDPIIVNSNSYTPPISSCNAVVVNISSYPQDCNPIVVNVETDNPNCTDIVVNVSEFPQDCNPITVLAYSDDPNCTDITVEVDIVGSVCEPIIVEATPIITIEHWCIHIEVEIDEVNLVCEPIVVNVSTTNVDESCTPIIVNVSSIPQSCDPIVVTATGTPTPSLTCGITQVIVSSVPQSCDAITVTSTSIDTNCNPITVNVSTFPQICNGITVKIDNPIVTCPSIIVNTVQSETSCDEIFVTVESIPGDCDECNEFGFIEGHGHPIPCPEQCICGMGEVTVSTTGSVCELITVIAYPINSDCTPILVEVSEFPQDCNPITVIATSTETSCLPIIVTVTSFPQVCNPIIVTVTSTPVVIDSECTPIVVTTIPTETSCDAITVTVDPPINDCSEIVVTVNTFPQDCSTITVIVGNGDICTDIVVEIDSTDNVCNPVTVTTTTFPQDCDEIVVEVDTFDKCPPVVVEVDSTDNLCNIIKLVVIQISTECDEIEEVTVTTSNNVCEAITVTTTGTNGNCNEIERVVVVTRNDNCGTVKYTIKIVNIYQLDYNSNKDLSIDFILPNEECGVGGLSVISSFERDYDVSRFYNARDYMQNFSNMFEQKGWGYNIDSSNGIMVVEIPYDEIHCGKILKFCVYQGPTIIFGERTQPIIEITNQQFFNVDGIVSDCCQNSSCGTITVKIEVPEECECCEDDELPIYYID